MKNRTLRHLATVAVAGSLAAVCLLAAGCEPEPQPQPGGTDTVPATDTIPATDTVPPTDTIPSDTVQYHPIVNVKWRLEKFVDRVSGCTVYPYDGWLDPLHRDSAYYAIFRPDGNLFFVGSTNYMFGEYAINGDSIHIKMISQTDVIDDVGYEGRIVSAMDSVQRYEFGEDTLGLFYDTCLSYMKFYKID